MKIEILNSLMFDVSLFYLKEICFPEGYLEIKIEILNSLMSDDSLFYLRGICFPEGYLKMNY